MIKIPEIPTSVSVMILLVLVVCGIIVAQVTSKPVPDFLTISFTAIVSYILGKAGNTTKGSD